MRPFDGIIFDLGGTLIYFDGDWPEVLQRADWELFHILRAAGLDLDEQTFLTAFRGAIEAYYVERESEFIEYTTLLVLRDLLTEQGYPEVPPQILQDALNALYAVTQQHWLVEADAAPVLHTLREQGYRLGMISNAGHDADVQDLVDKSGLRPFFDVILTSAAEGIRKPNPRIFQTLLDLWGISPSRTAMVGDTLGADILGARNAGIFGIWVTRRADNPANRAHASTILPDAAIATLSDLPGLLESLTG